MKQQINFTKILCVIVGIVIVGSVSIVIAINEPSLIFDEILIAASIVILAVGVVLVARNYIKGYFLSAARSIDSADDTALNEFSLAVMISNSMNEVVWYNEKFRSSVLKGIDVFGNASSFIFDESAQIRLSEEGYARIEYNEKYFNV
ncbi:MAG: hypothetical protein IJO19_00715, partial [Clostridia bacterium]|nr:hypothetical protein [Clostridia bacterium]